MKDSHYRLLGLVEEGQFGKVYTGIHRQTGELVALKELSLLDFTLFYLTYNYGNMAIRAIGF